MLFNSVEFALFVFVVFILYWFVFDKAMQDAKWQLRIQNVFLLVSSYFFYAWWDWRFLGLLILVSTVSWLSTRRLGVSGSKNKLIVTVCIIFDILTLSVFKYFGFFIDTFMSLFNMAVSYHSIKIILPLGISFYIFQAISYTIDAYHGKFEDSDNGVDSLLSCFLYIGFFPKLLAGPIEKTVNLIPQINTKRVFNYDLVADGSRQMLWGLLKKVAVADTCATYVNAVYSDFSSQSASTLVLAAVLYSIQIYCDFSGYSDMAIGCAKLFGFRFRDNFLYPYFSRNMGEFWKRWHISLNTWFVDYVYIPLGGSRCVRWKVIRNTMIIFVLSGLWHGADWSFVCWGGYHGLLLVVLILLGKNKKYNYVIAENRIVPKVREILQMLSVFILSTFGWILFRSDNINQFFDYICGMFDTSIFVVPWLMNRKYYIPLFVIVVGVFFVEWLQRSRKHAMDIVSIKSVWLRYLIYYVIVFVILYYIFQSGNEQTFIYMHF